MANASLADYMSRLNPATQAGLIGAVQIITNNSIFMRRLRFIKVTGPAPGVYRYSQEQSLGGIAFRGLNETYTPDTGVVNPQVELCKIFGGSVNTDRLLLQGPEGHDTRAQRVAAKIKRAALTYDKTVIDGNSATAPKEFDGLNRRLTGGQVITQATNGDMLTLAKLDEALDQTLGSNDQKIIVCSKAVRRQITDLVLDAAGGAAIADVNKGTTTYKGAQIEEIDEDGDTTVILDFDETVGNSDITTSLYVLNVSGNMDQENLRGLMWTGDGGEMIQKVVYPEINGFAGDLIEAVGGLAAFHPRCATRLRGITET